MQIENFDQLRAKLQGGQPRTAVVCAAHDAHTLSAVFHAAKDGLIRYLLVGRPEEITALAAEMGETLPDGCIVAGDSGVDCAAKTVELIRAGRGDLIIKGGLQTAELLHAVVNRETGIRNSAVMSHVAIMDVPCYPRLMLVTDGGMCVQPTPEQKEAILQNGLNFARFLGVERPKAAVLCPVETVSPKMPVTLDAAALKEKALTGAFGECDVEGPISFDLATDPEAVAIKHYQSPVAGCADLLLVPEITCGNAVCKALYGMAGAKMAGCVLGATVPITVNSRGASADEKYFSILIGAAACK